MNYCKDIKRELESTYHVSFDVRPISGYLDQYLVTLSGSHKDRFQIRINIKSGIRLIVSCTPENYGGWFLHELNKANQEKRQNFCNHWKYLEPDHFSVIINDQRINPDEFLNDKQIWKHFELRYNASPFFEEGKETPVVKICDVTNIICGMILSLIDFEIEGNEEGKQIKAIITKYERDPINRQICLAHKGYKCSVCGFDFEKEYGEIGKNFIEVHHSIMVSQMEDGHVVDPIKELFPLCSNCHSMIHRKFPPYTVEELIEIRKKIKS